ncbi:hypothetical protein CGRA01v4_12737 [Colletotrichum graminicola]|nr:hypothetical protein CGRA01v4_12737 [Colletotrichum graminicola]
MKLRSRTICSNEQPEINIRHEATPLPRPLWKALPQEIRLMVLRDLRPLANKKRQMAHWASVSKEWQYFFEPEIFKTLRICSPGSDIDHLRRIVTGYRRRLVTKISLHVGMTEYASAEYGRPEDSDTITANNLALAGALTALFSILSKWGKPTSKRYIGLQLSAGSISDNHHPYKTPHRHFLRQRARDGWNSNAKKRLLGNLLDPGFQDQDLPSVPIIKIFSMDAHYYRSLSGASMEQILSSLPRLQAVSYLSWRAVDRNGQGERDAASKTILGTIANTRSIQEVVFWEARSKTIHKPTRFYRTVSYSLVHAAIRASYRLQRFAISHAIDAAYFFQFHNTRTISRDWPNLTTLALTTYLGRLLSSPAETNSLILGAGNAALCMPKLEIMEVWAPGKQEGFFFRYEVRKDDTTELFIAATWQLQIDWEAIKPWQRVADRYAPLQFICNVETISPKTLRSSI